MMRAPNALPAAPEKAPARSAPGHRSRAAVVQPKLTIGEPDDAYEREADRVADEVMRMPDPQAAPPRIQRMCSACEEEVQRKAGEDGAEHPSELDSYVGGLPGRGEPLGAQARSFFEPRFGVDLSAVRVHRDMEADRSARSIDALAYTAGEHIVFRAGRYDPSSDRGRHLLAHELTHVLQQGGATSAAAMKSVQRSPSDGVPTPVGNEPTARVATEISSVHVYHGEGFTRIGDDEVVVRASMNARPAPGWHDVYVHGSPVLDTSGKVHVFFKTGDTFVDTADVVKAIRSNPSWQGKPVRLVACLGAYGADSRAEALAAKLGTTTWGVSGKVFVWQFPDSHLLLDVGAKGRVFPWPPGSQASADMPGVSEGVPSGAAVDELGGFVKAAEVPRSAGAAARAPAGSAARELAAELDRNETQLRRMGRFARGIQYAFEVWNALRILTDAAKAWSMSTATLAGGGTPFLSEIRQAANVEAQAAELDRYYDSLNILKNQMPLPGDPEWDSQYWLFQIQLNYLRIEQQLYEASVSVKAAIAACREQIKALRDEMAAKLVATGLAVTSLEHGVAYFYADAGGKMNASLVAALNRYGSALSAIEDQRRKAQAAVKGLEQRLRALGDVGVFGMIPTAELPSVPLSIFSSYR